MQLTKPKLTDTFYNELQSYKYYNNLLPKGVSAYNFGIFSEDLQPSGTVNFTMLKGKLINFNLNSKFIEEYFDNVSDNKINLNNMGILIKFYSRSYNFFVVEKDEKYGFINKAGLLQIPVIYDEVGFNITDELISVKQKNKWG